MISPVTTTLHPFFGLDYPNVYLYCFSFSTTLPYVTAKKKEKLCWTYNLLSFATTTIIQYIFLLVTSFAHIYLHSSRFVTPFYRTCGLVYQPRLEKSSKISLVVSSLVLNLIPKIPACLELSYVIIYTGSPSIWVISGNPRGNL